jgi:hypothetical protein
MENVGKKMSFNNNTNQFFRVALIPAVFVSCVERHLRSRAEDGYDEALVV